MKLGIVRLGRKFGLGVPSVFVFFALEALSKIGVVHEHLGRLGVTDARMILIGTASVVIGSSLFHVYTSILYLKSERILPTLMFCTIWHFLTNLLVDRLPPFSAPLYIAGPWLFVLVDGFIFAAFLSVGHRWQDRSGSRMRAD